MIIGGIVTAFFICFYFIINPMGIEMPHIAYEAGTSAVSPAFWPNIITLMGAFLGLGLICSAVIRQRAQIRQAAEAHWADRSATIARLLSMAALLLYSWVIEILGMISASYLLFVALAFLVGERTFWRPFVAAGIYSVILYYFFVKVANVPMPPGLIG